jgi:hypothetical protein
LSKSAAEVISVLLWIAALQAANTDLHTAWTTAQAGRP